MVEGAAAMAVVELTEPQWDGSKLAFTATPVGDIPVAATDVSLFVDQFPTTVNDQITD